MTNQLQMLGPTIRGLRKERELSQGELAGIVGVSRQSIYEIEKGDQTPHLTTLVRIAEALRVSPAALLQTEGTEPDSALIARLRLTGVLEFALDVANLPAGHRRVFVTATHALARSTGGAADTAAPPPGTANPAKGDALNGGTVVRLDGHRVQRGGGQREEPGKRKH